MKRFLLIFLGIFSIAGLVFYYYSIQKEHPLTLSETPEKTADSMLYTLQVNQFKGKTRLNSKTKLIKFDTSTEGTNSPQSIPVSALSNIQCLKNENPNDNAYPRIIVKGPGSLYTPGKSFFRKQLNTLLLGNVEVSGVFFEIGGADHLIIFPKLTTGFISEKIWYEFPFGLARSNNTHPTTIRIDGDLEIPQKSVISSITDSPNTEFCGAVSIPSGDFVKTDFYIDASAHFFIGHSKSLQDKKWDVTGFDADAAHIRLEDSSIHGSGFKTSPKTHLIVTGACTIDTRDDRHPNILDGQLDIACKDSNYASEPVCKTNDTFLHLKGYLPDLKAKTTFFLSFDPDSKSFSIGQIDLTPVNTKARINLSHMIITLENIISSGYFEKLSPEDKTEILNTLINKKFTLIKSQAPLNQIPKLALTNLREDKEDNFLKRLERMGKTFSLRYDDKTFNLILEVTDLE